MADEPQMNLVTSDSMSGEWYICFSKLTITGSDTGLSPGGRQAMIGTNAVIWVIGPLGKNVSGILIEIHAFLFEKINPFQNVVWKMAAIYFSPPMCLLLIFADVIINLWFLSTRWSQPPLEHV